jgi:hypothetical protein
MGANPKWLADYCGNSLTMIEKHYGNYIRNDSEEQLSRQIGAKSEPLCETVEVTTGRPETQAAERLGRKLVGPPGFEPAREKK